MSPSLVAQLPSVKVGGRPYSIRFSQGAFYLLSTWGIDVSRAVEVHNEMIGSGRAKEYAMKLAAAALGSLDAEGRWRSLGMQPLDLADALLDGEWEVLDSAVWDEYKKKLGLVVRTQNTGSQTGDTQPSDGSNSGPSEPQAIQAA